MIKKFKFRVFPALVVVVLFAHTRMVEAQSGVSESFVTLEGIFVRNTADSINLSEFSDQPYANLIQLALSTPWDSTNIHSLDESMTEILESKKLNAKKEAYLYYTWATLYDINFVQRMDLLEKAISLYQKLDDVEGQIHCLSDFAKTSYDITFRSTLDESHIQTFRDIARLVKKTTDPFSIRRAIHHQLDYAQLSSSPLSKPQLDSMLSIYKNLPVKVTEIDREFNTLGAFAIGFTSLGELKLAEKLVMEALASLGPGDELYVSNLYNLAVIKARLSEVEASKKAALRAFKYRSFPKRSMHYSLASNIVFHLSYLYEYEGQYDSALYYEKVGTQIYDRKYHFDLKTQRAQNEYQFGLGRKQLEIENLSLQKQAADQRIKIITLVSVIVAIGLLTTLVFARKLRIANTKLKELIDSRDQLITIIGHDLRSPLKMYQGLAGSIDYLVKKKDWERLHEVGSYIDQTGKDLDIMLNNMLQWGLQQENTAFSNQEKIDLNEIIDSLQSPYQLAAREKGISLDLEVKDDKTGIGDPAAISVILTNLLDNVLKYSLLNTAVSFNVQVDSSRFQLEISNRTTETSFQKLRAIIESETLHEPKNHNSAKGGFGWMIIKKLLKQLNGKVRFSGNPNHAQLNISLPLSA